MYIYSQNSIRPSALGNSATEKTARFSRATSLAPHTRCQSLAQPHLSRPITSVLPPAHAAPPRHRRGSDYAKSDWP